MNLDDILSGNNIGTSDIDELSIADYQKYTATDYLYQLFLQFKEIASKCLDFHDSKMCQLYNTLAEKINDVQPINREIVT